MKIDYEYLGKILQVFIDSEKAHLDVSDLKGAGIQVTCPTNNSLFDDKFIFHIQIALDNELISDKNGQNLGLETLGIKINFRQHMMLAAHARLTQQGHDFANALNNKEILEKLKTELKDAPFKIVFEGGQKLLQHYFKKKLSSMLSE